MKLQERSADIAEKTLPRMGRLDIMVFVTKQVLSVGGG